MHIIILFILYYITNQHFNLLIDYSILTFKWYNYILNLTINKIEQYFVSTWIIICTK